MKKGAPKYQNKIGFKMRYHDHYTEKVQNAPLDRLCELCIAQIEWKIKYGKYKTPHDLSRCAKCERKNIFKAYRRLCDSCSDELKQCSKCLEQTDLQEESSSGEEMEETLKCLRERSKRTILRRLEKDEISWDKHKKNFVENETGEQLIVQFKKDYIDEEDEQQWEDNDENNDSDEDDDQSDEEKQIIQKKHKSKQENKQIKQQQVQKKQKKDESSDDEDIDDDEDDRDHETEQFQQQIQIQQEIYTDGSGEDDYIQRKEKNYHFYFNQEQQQEVF